MLAFLLPQAEQALGILLLMIQRGCIFIYLQLSPPAHPLSCPLYFILLGHRPGHTEAAGASTAVVPSPRTGLFLPCGAHPLTSTELFTKDFPPSYSWSGLAGSAEEIWKGNLKRILLEVAVLPVGFGCWRADQHKHVILCYIKSNIPCYSVSSPPRVSPFCIIESVLYLWRCPYFLSRPLLKLSVLQSLLMKQTIPTPKGQKRRTWCSSAECCLFGLIRIVLKWLTPNSSCAQNCVSP